jgi:hypothetical protein
MNIRFVVFKKTAAASGKIRIITTPGKWLPAGDVINGSG